MTKIEHWAYIESQIKQEVSKVLKVNGFTRSAFRELETQAIEEMGAEDMCIETGFGSVVRHFEVEQSGSYCDRLILTSSLAEAPQSVGEGLGFLLPKRRTRNV